VRPRRHLHRPHPGRDTGQPAADLDRPRPRAAELELPRWDRAFEQAIRPGLAEALRNHAALLDRDPEGVTEPAATRYSEERLVATGATVEAAAEFELR
jgi:hypothetical protein